MKNVVLSVFALSLFGCGGGSDSDDSLLNTVATVVQESDEDDYKKSEYRFYGLFAGSSGEDQNEIFSEMIIDNSQTRFTSITVADGFREFNFKQGSFSKNAATFLSDIVEYDIDIDILITGVSNENNIGSRFHFNYDKQSEFQWSINGSQKDSTLEFMTSNSSNAFIPRTMIYPAKLSFFDSGFISQIEYGNSNLTTSLTIDSDGDITGSDSNGCLFNGKVTRGNKHVNSYPVNLEINNCSNNLNNGVFTGLISLGGIEGTSSSLTDRVDGDATNIRLMIHNPYRAIYFSLDRN